MIGVNTIDLDRLLGDNFVRVYLFGRKLDHKVQVMITSYADTIERHSCCNKMLVVFNLPVIWIQSLTIAELSLASCVLACRSAEANSPGHLLVLA